MDLVSTPSPRKAHALALFAGLPRHYDAVVNRSAATTAPRSDTANTITMSLLNDSCLGG